MSKKKCSISLAISEMQIKTIMRYYFTPTRMALEKEMAIHSSVLAWRIPGMAEPGLLSMGHTESDTTEAT